MQMAENVKDDTDADHPSLPRGCGRVFVSPPTEYASGVMHEALSRCGLSVGDENSPVMWVPLADVDVERLLDYENPSRFSCFLVRAGFVRKGPLAHYMKKFKLLEGVMPETLNADVEDEADLMKLEKQLNVLETTLNSRSLLRNDCPHWIVKASSANGGEGIYVCTSAKDISNILREAALSAGGPAEWVLQRYIPPLLVNGCKFHIRAHLLVSGCPKCGHVRAWLHQDHALALISQEKWSPDVNSRLAHLTNYCVQRAARDDDDWLLLTLSELEHVLERPGLKERVVKEMERCSSAALTAVVKAPVAFSPLPHCFEMFGLDFALDDAEPTGVWLLEVNSGSDLSIFRDKLRGHCVELLSDILKAAVLPYLDFDVIGGGHCKIGPEYDDTTHCICGHVTAETGFGECLWSQMPKCRSLAEDIKSFRRRFNLAMGWAKEMHTAHGNKIRGPVAGCVQEEHKGRDVELNEKNNV